MRTLVVSGALANKPRNGGEAWVRLSWVKGLRRLGFRVFLVEQIAPRTCTNLAGDAAPFRESFNLDFFQSVTRSAGLEDSAALLSADGEAFHGMHRREVEDVAASAELLVNISGHLTLEPLFSRFRRTAFVDIDPGFTQFWHADGTAPIRPHDVYFTIGENIGAPDCPIPSGGIPWRKVRQPVVLEDWPASPADPTAPFTTVASWRGPFGRVTVGDRTYRLKLHEFRKFVELPRRVNRRFELALDIHPAEVKDLALLRENGWHLIDPKEAAATPDAFRRYVQASAAEFSVAQGIYVETRSGWFSDRTTRYLASGKPALVQDTGFGRNLPSGDGLVTFQTIDEAVAGAERIAADYAAHCKAARVIAEKWFDSDEVLSRLLEQAGVSP